MIQRPMKEEGKSEAEINAWKMVNSMIQSWIMNVLEPKLHKSVAYVDSTQKL